MQSWVNNNKTAFTEVSASGKTLEISYRAFYDLVQSRAKWLKEVDAKSVALALDNTIEWVAFDLACLQTGTLCTPLPAYFSDAQKQHVLEQSQVEWIISAQTSPLKRAVTGRANAPEGTQKITFTSGSTGTPKGVCLSTEQQLNVARAISQRVGLTAPTFLSLLPLPTLLENVAGIYGTLLANGHVVLADEASRGFEGSRLTNPDNMLTLLSHFEPNAINLVPELLLILVGACRQGWQPPKSLNFIAVGGSRVDSNLLNLAQQCGLPVFQGYGLSECASVVALNSPAHNNPLSVGKPLDHVNVDIENNEVVVTGNTFLGYLGDEASWYPTKVNTGDLARWEGDDLVIEGRRKNLLINSFGRNIAPEWPESVLMASGQFKQAFVFGDGKPALVALVTPINPAASDAEIQRVITHINQQLPDYAQVKYWLNLGTGLTPETGLVTDNFRPKRPAILAHFESQIDSLYSNSH
ncbi:AMP-binding protein [Alteromonas sp. a30]|nr:AMP-binding protein [Alteromonas sp. a30]